MTSSLDHLLRLISRLAPRSVVARTTLAIFGFSLVLGLGFALAAANLVHEHEYSRLESELEQLVSTVESTTQIACYLNDQTLAREVVTGLMKTDAVGGVRIMSGNNVLYESMRPGTTRRGKRVAQIDRPINSPFDASRQVGSMTVYLSPAQLHAHAWTYTRFILLILAGEVAAVSGGVALTVFLVVTRPIKGISDELHRLRQRAGPLLQVPAGNEGDEIGRLVADVNSLIASLNQLVEAERSLRIQHEVFERQMRLVLEKTALGICIMDEHGALQSCNPAFLRLLAIPKLGTDAARTLQQILAPYAAEIGEMISRCHAVGKPCEADFEVWREEHAAVNWIELSLNPLGPQLLLGVIDDVTERKRSVAAAQQLAMSDPLTGLLNRRGLEAAIAHAFAAAANPGGLAMLAIDLDHFKEVNDTLGHEAGDRVLHHVGRVIAAAVRRTDLVGRLGGDEFLAVLVGVGPAQQALQIAEDIIARLDAPLELQGTAVRVGASIGIAVSAGNEDNPAALLRRADAAMYASKQAGRGRARLAEESAEQAEQAEEPERPEEPEKRSA
ncbi:MAG TPA: diguanylate cyclase [Steroidobacteraceae bacterium]|nr:diguanylate cyclase [Steroidobacteraceae bacterium]